LAVLDPVVPVAEVAVVALVLQHLNLASDVLGQLGLQVGERALDHSSVVPGASVDRLAVLAPERDVQLLLSQLL
ncbi:hypothetical protein PENTCL1PPCAC_25082, partial [Pristionchus entomophagus]